MIGFGRGVARLTVTSFDLIAPEIAVTFASSSFRSVRRSVACPFALVLRLVPAEASAPALVVKMMGTSDIRLLLLSKTVATNSVVKLGEVRVGGLAVRRILIPSALPMSTRASPSSGAKMPAPERAMTVARPARPLLRRVPRATPFCISTRSSMVPTSVVKKIWVPSVSGPPPSATALKPTTVMVETPSKTGMAVGLAVMKSVAPSVAVKGTSPPHPARKRSASPVSAIAR